jgi:hypothetical protein
MIERAEVVRRVRWLAERKIIFHTKHRKTDLQKPAAVISCRDGRYSQETVRFHCEFQHGETFFQPHPIFGGILALAPNSPVYESPGADTVCIAGLRKGWHMQNQPNIYAKAHISCLAVAGSGIDVWSSHLFDLFIGGLNRVKRELPDAKCIPLIDFHLGSPSCCRNTQTWVFEPENWGTYRHNWVDFLLP